MLKHLWFLGSLLLVAAVSFAQAPLPPAGPASPALIDVTAPSMEEVTLLPESQGRDGADLVRQSQQSLEKMRQGIEAIEKKREDAQRDKDLIKLNCLSGKVARAKEHLVEAQGALKLVVESYKQGDSAARTFAANRIRIYHQKILVLVADADGCVGEEASYVGPGRTEVDVDPTVPKGDPTDPGLPTPTATLAPVGVEEAVRDSPSSGGVKTDEATRR